MVNEHFMLSFMMRDHHEILERAFIIAVLIFSAIVVT